jgi:hypothetical protein
MAAAPAPAPEPPPGAPPVRPGEMALRLVGGQGETNQLLIERELLRPAQARDLLALVRRQGGGEPERIATARLIQEARLVAAHKVARFFGLPRPLLDRGVRVENWPTGAGRRPRRAGAAPAAPLAVLILEAATEGGIVYAPALGLAVRPEAGMLLGLAEAAREDLGVTRVDAGRLCALVLELTDDPAAADPVALAIA